MTGQRAVAALRTFRASALSSRSVSTSADSQTAALPSGANALDTESRRVLKPQEPRHAEFPFFPNWVRCPPMLRKDLPVGRRDPWYERHTWIYDPFWSKKSRLMEYYPGLGIATIAFGIYVAYDTYGPPGEERAKWDQWAAERQKRLHHDAHH